MNLTHTQIIDNSQIAPDIFSMTVRAPKIAATARAGQFVMVYLPNGELLLPRPISICDKTDDTLRLVYQVVGKGTAVMAQMPVGGTVKILGSLGKGFFTKPGEARTAMNKVALVGGGIGTPPLLLLAKTLKAQDANVDVYLGFRQHPILVEEFEAVADTIRIATEYGSVGHRGSILDVLQSIHVQYDEILTCGPRGMLNAVAAHATAHDTPCQISTEERMACGIGTCVGCALSVNGTNVRICTEGPVFYANTVSNIRGDK